MPPIPLEVVPKALASGLCNTEEDAIFSSDEDYWDNNLFVAKNVLKQNKSIESNKHDSTGKEKPK